MFMLLPGKSGGIYHNMWRAIRSLICERRTLTLEPTTVHIYVDFEVAMHALLKNAQCTAKRVITSNWNAFQVA